MNLEPIIGLEIHLELDTKSKLFCSCPNETNPLKPNINICPICLGHPGVLPAINRLVLEKAILLGLALEGTVSETSIFDRKNYFYPDLPKGYQISQYKLPLIQGGLLEIKIANEVTRIHFERIHIEEDTAKLIHDGDPVPEPRRRASPDGIEDPRQSRDTLRGRQARYGARKKYSLIDFNRSGVPLLEIVTKPEIHSPKLAKVFLQELQLLARYIHISHADMEHGEMRCDTNISLRPKGSVKLFSKTEIKNLNSFKSVEDSLIYEIKRQTGLWEDNKTPKIGTTRGWNENKHVTYEQRRKEEEQDYRYFPEPDLPPLSFKTKDAPFNIDEIGKMLPELPIPKRERFMRDYGFSLESAKMLTNNRSLADFTEKVISEIKVWLSSLETVEGAEEEIWDKNKKKLVTLMSNWLINRYLPMVSFEQESPISPENFAEFIILVYEKKISSTISQKILEKMVETRADPDYVIDSYQLQTVDDISSLGSIIKNVCRRNPDVVEKFRAGNINVIQFLVGLVMKQTKGQADPEVVMKMLKQELER